MKILELRIHGIGPHDPWSASGRPRVTRGLLPSDALKAFQGRRDELETSVPPLVPDHRVELVNWSKSSRKNAGLFWYLALPFTLINVAVRMQSVGSGRWSSAGNLVLKFGAQIAAVATSVLATVWVMTLAENLLFIHFGASLLAHKIACGIAAISLSAGILFRLAMRAGDTTRWPTGMLHAFIIAGFAAACIVLRPGTWDAWPGPFAWARNNIPDLSTADPGDLVARLDFVAVTCGVATTICMIIAVVLVIVQLGERRVEFGSRP